MNQAQLTQAIKDVIDRAESLHAISRIEIAAAIEKALRDRGFQSRVMP